MKALFCEADLDSTLSAQEKQWSNEIASLSEDRVLKTSPEELCNFFVRKYRVAPLVIDRPKTKVDYGDVQVEVTHRFDYAVIDRRHPTYVTGTRITFYVPFSGEPALLKCRPSRYSFSPPRATVSGNELIFIYERTSGDATNIGSEFERDISDVMEYADWIATDVDRFNRCIQEKVTRQIEERRSKVLNDRGIVEDLGFPLKRRSHAPITYVTPAVKKRIPRLPPVSAEPYQPEPILGMEQYEHILSIMSNMVLVMEHSPRAFKDMREEDLRQHFLVQLNGHYEGQATGETFNYQGKTDILIRDRGKNLFIAECKFWNGPSGLTAGIDQLLSYTSWRDTKTALLIFVRDTTMSTVLKRIPETVKEHTNYKADSEYKSETAFRYTFAHMNDCDRELILTVLVFDIPT